MREVLNHGLAWALVCVPLCGCSNLLAETTIWREQSIVAISAANPYQCVQVAVRDIPGVSVDATQAGKGGLFLRTPLRSEGTDVPLYARVFPARDVPRALNIEISNTNRNRPQSRADVVRLLAELTSRIAKTCSDG